MKKKITTGLLFIAPVVAVLIAVVLNLSVFSSAKSVSAQADQNISAKMLNELKKEQKLLEKKRRRLEQYERNLNAFEAELEGKNSDYLASVKKLEEQQKIFDEKVNAKMVDRQTIETYENIDPEQAAILIRNLYARDDQLAILVMRKIAGKKAGKILEAMIPLDRETSTQLAQKSLDYYKPK